MADLTVTPANVVRGANAVTETRDAGEAIAAGKAMYVSPTTKAFMLADSNSVTAGAKVATHIALNSAAAGQPMTGQSSGELNPGATLTVGAGYYLSDTPGGICPDA